MIVVGIDPHKRSHAVCAIAAATGEQLAELTVSANERGHQELLLWARGLSSQRRFAIEDCRHVSRALERALLLAGEQLVRVAPRLTAQQRTRGRARGKSDRIDALATARACLAWPDLPSARLEGPQRQLAILTNYRDQLVAERTATSSRLRWLLLELQPQTEIPTAALSRRTWLNHLQQTLQQLPDNPATHVARAHLARLSQLHTQIHHLQTEISSQISQLAPRLLTIPGCGPLTAAKLLTEIAAIDRFPSDAHLASYAGCAPLQASSGNHQRHRLNRTGNRQLNLAIHRIAITQARCHPPTRSYLNRHTSNGKTPREALRAYKRHLIRHIYNTLTTPDLT